MNINPLLFFRAKVFQYQVQLFGSGRFNDRFGLSYTIWKDTKPFDTVVKGARLDDLGVPLVFEDIFKMLVPAATEDNPVTCVDVGTFIGIVSMFMADRVGQVGEVHSFEPSPVIYERAKKNFTDAGLSNVTLNNLAASDTNGEGILFNTSPRPGCHHIVHDPKDVPEGSLLKVSTVTLDSYLEGKGISKVDVLKIDAEGSDDKVLAGASKLLSEHRVSYLIGEHEAGDMYEGLLSSLQGMGYRCYFMVRHTNRLLRDITDYPKDYPQLLNFLAVSPEAGESGLNIS